MPSMRTILHTLCGFTLLAASWLAVMFVVLHRPGYERGVSMSLIFVIQSLLTMGVSTDIVSGPSWRILAGLGGAGIIWVGGVAVANTLDNAHFEGYVLVIGVALALQGLVTLQQLITTSRTRSSEVHQFGN
jgi:hypothetical protein